MNSPVAVILAGGQARRMGGGAKGLLRLGEKQVIDHVLERITPQVDGIVLNVNCDETPWLKYQLPIKSDSIKGHVGPLGGILAGLDWAQGQGASHVISVAADTPFFPEDLVPQLIWATQREDKPIAIAATRENDTIYNHPTFGLWPVYLANDLRVALKGGVRKVMQWATPHGAAQALFPTPNFDPFFNINTPADLEKAQALL